MAEGKSVKTKRVTINEVAAAAGVSRGAVTRALNNKPDINQDTKKRVLEVATQLGYRPSRFAKNFAARKKSRALGYVLASFRNPFYTDLAADMLHHAKQRGWQVVLAASEGTNEQDAFEGLAGQVDVVIGHFSYAPEQLKAIVHGLPVVLLEEPSNLDGIHSIVLDMRSGIKDAVEALYAKGAKNIGMIDSDYSLRHNSAYSPSPRCQYFKEFVKAETRDAVVWNDESFSGGAAAVSELMAKRPEIDAIIVFNDMMAIGAVQGAHLAGFDVPGRLRILGIDGLSMGEAISPTLSSLSINRSAIVREALDLAELLASHQFRELPSINRITVPHLLWRESA